MSRIEATFKALDRPALVSFITAGDLNSKIYGSRFFEEGLHEVLVHVGVEVDE